MTIRFAQLRYLLFAAVAASGCECGEGGLRDVRAELVVAPAVLDFGPVVRGELRVLGLELANRGTASLRLTRSELVAGSSELFFAAPVPEVLAPEQRRSVSLAYQPVDLGEDLGTLTFAADDGRPPIVVRLRGLGVESGVGVTGEGPGCDGAPGSLGFGRVTPGATVERTLTLTSQGGSPLSLLGAAVEPGTSGEFTVAAGPLPTTLAPGAAAVLTVRYTPADGGPDDGALVLTTDAPASPTVRVRLCGIGAAPALCGRPSPLDLGAAAEGEHTSGRLTLESCGTEPVELAGVALATDAQHLTDPGFRLTTTPTVPQTLAPGRTLEVELSFTGRAPLGPKQGFVEARSNALGAASAYFPLTARTAAPCQLLVSPAELAFRGVAVGQRAQKNVLVANPSGTSCELAALSVTSTAGAGVFALDAPPSTPLTLAPGASEVLALVFTPASLTPVEGRLEVRDAAGGVQGVGLHGNAPEDEGCAFEVSPASVGFGVTAVGAMAHRTVRVEAVGGAPCRVMGARLLAGDPVLSVTLPALRTVFPGVGGVNLDLVYAPTAASPLRDLLQVDVIGFAGNPGGGSAVVAVSGGAADARLCVTPGALDFGAVPVGGSGSAPVTVTSCGATELNLRGVRLQQPAGGPFRLQQAPTIPQGLAPGAVAAPGLVVAYAPTTVGPHFGMVELLSSDRTAPSLRLPLTGNFAGGCDRILQCAPTALAFGDTYVGGSSALRVVCRNMGSAPVTVASAGLAGGGPELQVSARTPATILAGDAWSFDLTYAPNAPGLASATLSVTSDACLGPAQVPVTGAAVEAPLPPCQPPSVFSPRTQWQWTGSAVEPSHTNVWSTPLVANLNDDNGDGRIDQDDVPEVIFLAIDRYSATDPGAANPAVLRVVRGDTGVEEFSVTEPRFVDSSILALGDLDGDGAPELVGCRWTPTPPGSGVGGLYGRFVTGTLVALDHTGRLLWESDPWSWPSSIIENASAISVADLDGDGFGEVIMGRDVWDHQGHLKWRGAGSYGQVSDGIHSVVADLDLDGRPEVLAGGTVYRHDGTVALQLPGIVEGGVAVGMLDLTDPYPQIAVHDGDTLHVFDHAGVERWSTPVGSTAPATMLPILADFDGDGDADVAVADGMSVQVLHGTGGLMWTAPSSDSTCCVGISAFDFEGDGPYELILNDFGSVYVYRGATGQELYSAPRPSVTAFELPVVADIDNDGKGELVVALYGPGQGGIVAYSNVGDTWASAPRIWNQQAFHVANIYENGTLPRSAAPLTRAPKVFRGTAAACR